MAQQETYRPAFEDSAASKTAYTSTAGKLSTPDISYGLPYPQACAKHVNETFHCSRVYVIVSGTMSRNHPETLERLIEALGKDKVVGVRKGMQSHTLWSEILEIVAEAREARADCIVTLGAGSVTDGAKIVCLVRDRLCTEDRPELFVSNPFQVLVEPIGTRADNLTGPGQRHLQARTVGQLLRRSEDSGTRRAAAHRHTHLHSDIAFRRRVFQLSWRYR